MGNFNINDNPQGLGAIPWLINGLKTLWRRVNGISGGGSGGGAPSGPAGGDLAGTYPDPTISTNASPTIKGLTIDNRPGPSNLALGSTSVISDAAGALTIQANSLGLPANTQGQTQSIGDNSTKMATTAYADRAAGQVAVGAAITSGTANRLLYESLGNLVAESSSLTFDTFTLGVIAAFALTGAQTTTLTTLAATIAPGLTLQNTTAAISGAQVQYPPALYKLGHQWTNTADSIVGWRDKQTSSQSRGTRTIISDIDYTLDGTTYTNLVRNSATSAGNTNMTVTAALTANGITSTTSITAGNFLAGNGLIQAISTKTADYTTTVNDYTILADTSGGNITITVLASSTGTIFNIKKISAANTLTIVPLTGTIDGAASVVVIANNQNTCVHSNGSNLFIL